MVDAKNSLKVEKVEVPGLYLIGLPVNVSFKHGNFSDIGRTKEEFVRRLADIPNAVNHDEYYAPWFSCDVMFTYFYCLQVSSLEQIPEGMMGLEIPAASCLYVKYDGVHPFNADPYAAIHSYMDEHGLKPNPKAMALEKFLFANDGLDGRIAIEVFGPYE